MLSPKEKSDFIALDELIEPSDSRSAEHAIVDSRTSMTCEHRSSRRSRGRLSLVLIAAFLCLS